MLNENESVLSTVEIETLHSIYVNELEVDYNDESSPESVSLWLFPATADNVDKRYVRIRLIFKLPEEYPNVVPEIKICNTRGLSDEQIARIHDKLKGIAEDRKGSAMLFELIEAAKEQLTSENRPSDNCAICLYEILEEDVFTKTECYHYFHSHCLNSYVQWKDNDASDEEPESNQATLCPVCRIPITFQYSEEGFPEPVAESLSHDPLDISQHQMQKNHHLYQKQLAQGGIIDVEGEKNKYLLEISNVSAVNNLDTNNSAAAATKDNQSSDSAKVANGDVAHISKDLSPSRFQSGSRGYQHKNRRNFRDYGHNHRYNNYKNRQNYRDHEIAMDELKISDSDKPSPTFHNYQHHNRFNPRGGRQHHNDGYRTKYHYTNRSNPNRSYQNYHDRESEHVRTNVENECSLKGPECSKINEAGSSIPPKDNNESSLQNTENPDPERDTSHKKFPNRFNKPNFRNQLQFHRNYNDHARPSRNWQSHPHHSSKQYDESYDSKSSYQPSHNYHNQRLPRYGRGYSRPYHSNMVDGHLETSANHSFNSYRPHSMNNRGHPPQSRNDSKFKRVFSNDAPKNSKYSEDTSNQKNASSENQHLQSHTRNGKLNGIANCSRSSDSFEQSSNSSIGPPPGFANPRKKVVYGLPSVNPPPGFSQS